MNLLILGLDEGFKRRGLGYTDTIILISIPNPKHNLVMLSIPRDLWISISDLEENRVGVVYKYAEAKRKGKGLETITTLVSKSLQISVHYYFMVRMQGFINVVDSLGGVDIILSQSIAGYPTGSTHLDGRTALAFVRDRTDADDFSRMFQAQILIKGLIEKILKVESWSKFLKVLSVFRQETKSNIPIWEWLRFGYMILRSYANGIENYAITRDMVNPRITVRGEQIIEPNWDKIRALTTKIFKK
jgi:polyisoprenyl-teichoic acid--peptidoglycan teichoic acid transferase